MRSRSAIQGATATNARPWLGIISVLLLVSACEIAPESSPASVDEDGDGYGLDIDCDDGEVSVFPGAPEPADGLDYDCDGRVVLDQHPEDPAEVHGSVYVEVGGATRPIVGASVRLKADAVYTATVATNRLGRYSLVGPAGTNVKVCAAAPGFRQSCQDGDAHSRLRGAAAPGTHARGRSPSDSWHRRTRRREGAARRSTRLRIEVHSTVEIEAGQGRRSMRTDLGGGFVASVLPQAREAIVIARHGGHEASTIVSFDRLDSARTAPAIGLILDNLRPQVTLIEVRTDGGPVTHVAPGSTVQVVLEVIEPDGHEPALEFRVGQGTRIGPVGHRAVAAPRPAARGSLRLDAAAATSCL